MTIISRMISRKKAKKRRILCNFSVPVYSIFIFSVPFYSVFWPIFDLKIEFFCTILFDFYSIWFAFGIFSVPFYSIFGSFFGTLLGLAHFGFGPIFFLYHFIQFFGPLFPRLAHFRRLKVGQKISKKCHFWAFFGLFLGSLVFFRYHLIHFGPFAHFFLLFF